MMKKISSLLSLVGFLMVVLPGPLYQFAGLGLGTAFTLIRYGLFVAGAALIVMILQILINRKSVDWANLSVFAILALIAVYMPLNMMGKASAVPPIHDITTDVTNPPEFVAVAPLRKDAPNPVNYEGGEVTKQQLEAYPELKTVKLAQPVDEVYQAAEAAVATLGWKRVTDGARENTIEATDTTLWFGFKDDVVIRLTPEGDNTLVDVRSKSRVGKSDLGKNAERINTFMETLRDEL
ncbi:hypothetical protein GCM10007391_07930 [Alteromonas halophila]|uniref:DUF1499 domain-containing protein n=2 Tax=Alteromonas halophila TaxID=516698 RepID=A0A918JGC4_9ALTE|nr:hypothetical protein GCM10007391_07930 [Alteromonas halophila]